jgi:hypothetical protein
MRLLALLALLATLPLPATAHRARWGGHGHTIAAQAAVDALPAEMPAFFREARDRLVYLNPEPDRWRGGRERQIDPALGEAGTPEHYTDFELIPRERQAGFLAAPDRWAYADSLRAVGQRIQEVGLVTFAMLEHAQRLRAEFRLWRVAPNDAVRRHIEARIIDDAGILGHYVTDASNPAHTTIHFNGWKGDNPRGYATDDRFHGRFESAFVQARLTLADLAPVAGQAPRTFADLRAAVTAHFLESHAEVERMYAIDRATPFGPDNADPAAKAFAVARLGAGARMLRDLWWTAWVTSAPEAPR